jgi:SAM-dependent methyltransferase
MPPSNAQKQIPPASGLQRRLRVRTFLFLFAVALTLVFLSVLYQGVNTLRRLTVVEAERDGWQHPEIAIQALGLRDGSVVVDLGCGAGYFALKLGRSVGPHGRVIAVDLRKLSLAFLWIRALGQNLRNVSIVRGEPDNPRLPPGVVEAALIANTYHELESPRRILDSLSSALVPGGRLVVVDRGPESASPSHDGLAVERHEVPLTVVEGDLRLAGFEIVTRNPHFTDQPGEGPWWLVVARKPDH